MKSVCSPVPFVLLFFIILLGSSLSRAQPSVSLLFPFSVSLSLAHESGLIVSQRSTSYSS